MASVGWMIGGVGRDHARILSPNGRVVAFVWALDHEGLEALNARARARAQALGSTYRVVSHVDDFREVYFFGRCQECALGYWSYLCWNGNVPNPEQPGLRDKIHTWGPGHDLEAEKDEAVAQLNKRVSGHIVGPPLATKDRSTEEYIREHFVGLYTPLSGADRALLSRPVEGGSSSRT